MRNDKAESDRIATYGIGSERAKKQFVVLAKHARLGLAKGWM